MNSDPKMVIAGLREEGTECPQCHVEIHAGDQTTACPDCGNVHHWMCWSEGSGCAAYECAPNRRPSARESAAVLRISAVDLADAKPLPPSRPSFQGWTSAAPISLGDDPGRKGNRGPKKWNKLAIATLVVAIIGVPLFGLVTGLIAIALGCIALAAHTPRSKGALVAVFGILLGVADVAGWAIGLAWFMDAPLTSGVSLDEFEPDPKALEQLPGPISRAMKSNVLIQTPGDLTRLRGAGMGSGVIVRIKDGIAWIVTNRHVVDATFSEERTPKADPPPVPSVRLSVKAIGQPLVPGQLVWIAPHGIDLALITMPVSSREIMSAVWDATPKMTVGDSVFAVGNPHGLGWTHTQGGLSQLRLQSKGTREIRIIQTSAAINSGNSGGGLYDMQGHLLGINTWTKDKRQAEGLSFSIAFHTLLPLLPANFQLPESQLENDVP